MEFGFCPMSSQPQMYSMLMLNLRSIRFKKVGTPLYGVGLIWLFLFGIIRDDVREAEYLALARQPQFDCVGQVYSDTAAAGSCVLIHERYVLTAAHVLITSDVRLDTIVMNGQTMISHVPINERVADVASIYIHIDGQQVQAKAIALHPEFLKNKEEGPCDIALVELEKPFSNIAPAKAYTFADEMDSNVVGVGFGASGKAGVPDSIFTLSKKIAGENVIDKISGPEFEGRKTMLSCDFDDESRKECNKMGSPTPRPLEYICGGGDSGGGLFRQVGEDWFLVGICSGAPININQLMKTGYYGQVMEWTRVSAFTQWINTGIKN